MIAETERARGASLTGIVASLRDCARCPQILLALRAVILYIPIDAVVEADEAARCQGRY